MSRQVERIGAHVDFTNDMYVIIFGVGGVNLNEYVYYLNQPSTIYKFIMYSVQ
jgi:hypothetical protein